MMDSANEVKPAPVKKPRAFVGAEDSDLFDFSDMKIVIGSDAPGNNDDKKSVGSGTKITATATSSFGANKISEKS